MLDTRFWMLDTFLGVCVIPMNIGIFRMPGSGYWIPDEDRDDIF
jgi:hypothetical protein